MIEVRFCNYNKDYQQRLGFLKVVGRVGQGARGGPDDILDHVRSLYPVGQRPPLAGRRVEEFNPKELIRDQCVPSWIVGFVPKTLDRLVWWAEKVGLVAQSGRLSEWAAILDGIRSHPGETSWVEDNPFVLSLGERAFFVQLLFFHDQVLPFLVNHLGQFDAGTAIGVAESCVLVTQSLGDLLDRIKGNSPTELQLRFELRDLLERIGTQFRIDDPRRLVNSETRRDIVKSLVGERLKGVRVRLAEYHAISRCEQLTDLGLLTKEDPHKPPADEASREKARTSWTWYVTAGLPAATRILSPRVADLEQFFQESWLRFCTVGFGHKTRELDAFEDQRQIAALLDETLPLARRQLGPVQVHTWASLSCLRAIGQGFLLELSTIERLLEAMRIDPHTSNSVRSIRPCRTPGADSSGSQDWTFGATEGLHRDRRSPPCHRLNLRRLSGGPVKLNQSARSYMHMQKRFWPAATIRLRTVSTSTALIKP